MNNLIDRFAALEAVEDIDWYHQNRNKDMVHGANPPDQQAWYKAEDIYDALGNLQSAEQWVPCAERLPDASQNLVGFLVTSKFDNCSEDDTDVFLEVFYDGKFGFWNGEKLLVDDGVIAWMPVPDPWKGEK